MVFCFMLKPERLLSILIHSHPALLASKSARTVGAKGRVFPEALTQSALAGGGGVPFFAGKMHGTFIKHRNLQHFEAPDRLR